MRILELNIKPLIFIPSARDLREFYDATNKLPYDKLWVKYYPQYEAYAVARWTFLNNPNNYTHLVILPDDLIVEQKQIEKLLEHPDDIMSGWCMFGIKKTPDERKTLDSNISEYCPDEPAYSLTYDKFKWLSIEAIENYIKTGKTIIPIVFCGFAPTIIPKKYVDFLPFRGSQGCCIDTCISQDLKQSGIIHYADLTVKTVEIEATDPNLLQVDKKERFIVLESI